MSNSAKSAGSDEEALSSSVDINPAADASERVYNPSLVFRDDIAEGPIARVIEQQTAKIPSEVFLFASLGMMALSTYLTLAGKDTAARSLSIWAPALLIMGVYNKIVKMLQPR